MSRLTVNLLRLTLLLLGGGAASLFAQTAAIKGSVADPQSAVIPGASVEIVNGDKTVDKKAQSDGEGNYIVAGLPAGKYHLSAEMAGFQPFTSDELTLAAGQTLVVNIQLKVAEAAASEVRVQANNAATIELDSANISTTLSTQEIRELGLNGRNVSQLMAMAPGVSNQSGQDEGKVGVAGSAKFSVNGGRVEYNTFEVDGSDVLNTSINASRGQGQPLMVYPSVDAIADMKVLTSNYDAMYGKSASGAVLITTKQGTAQFHGNFYEFLRNEVFNARNYFEQPIQKPNGLIEKRTGLYRRHDFGFTIGGPIFIPGVFNTKKDKTFFFVSEEFRLEKTPVDYNQAVPTAAERQGDFSDVCPVFVPGGSPYFNPLQYPDCPYDRLSNTNGNFTPGRRVVVGNISQAILNTGIVPAPNSTFGCNTTNPTTLPRCYNTTVSPETDWHEDLFRIDHAITSNEQLSFRYIHDSWNTTTLTPQWGIVQNSFPTVANKLVGPGLDMVVILSQNLPHSFFNHVDVGYSEQHITLEPEPGPGLTSLARPPELDQPCSVATSGNQSATDCPIGYIFANSNSGGSTSKMPGLLFEGTNGAYGGHGFAVDTGYAPWEQRNPTYHLRDDVIKVWGKHQIQFGGTAAYVQQNELSAANGANSGDVQGLLTFSNQQSLNTSGNAFADFLMGPGINPGNLYDQRTAIKSFTQDSGQAKYYNRYKMAELYVEDTWHLVPRLTITGGFRASLFGTWYNPKNTAYNWRPEAYDQSIGASIMVDPSLGFLTHQTSAGSGVPGTPLALPDRTGPYTLRNLDPAITNGLIQCSASGIGQSCMSSNVFNAAPRFGLSWDPWGNGKTAVRGGYGIFREHGTGYEANVGSLIGSPPVVLSETQSNVPSPAGESYGPYNLIGYSCQYGADQCGTYSGFGAVTFPLNVTSIPKKAVYSYAQQWSLSVQRQFTNDVVGQIAYVGTKGTHLTAVRDLNQLNPLTSSLNPFAPGQPVTASVCNSGALYNYFSVTGSNPNGQTGIPSSPGIGPTSPGYTNMVVACTGNPGFVGTTGKAVGLSPDAVRPYIGYSNIISLDNIANSSYHAFQATFRATPGKLTLGASYSYSHSIDDSSDRASANFANSLDLRSNRASSDFDQRHLVNLTYIYDLPLEKILTGFRDLTGPPAEEDASNPGAPAYAGQMGSFWHSVLAGWQISGITIYQTGTPFSVVNGGGSDGTGASDNAGVGNGLGIGSYADIIGSAHGVKPVVSNSGGNIGPLVLNPSAYTAPRGLTFGNSGRNSLSNPSRVNFNVSLIKHFKLIHERLDMEFHAESFNIFNHTQFRIFDPSHPGNSGNNVVNCYGDITTSYSAGAQGCLAGNSFLHPVDAHDPRILQFALKAAF